MKFDTLYKLVVNEAILAEPEDLDLGDIEKEESDVDLSAVEEVTKEEILDAQETLGILPDLGQEDSDPDELNAFERKAYAIISIEKGYIARIKSGDMTVDEALQRIEDTDYPKYKLNYRETKGGFMGISDKSDILSSDRMTPDEVRGYGLNPEIDDDPLSDPDSYNYGDQ
jgi:hypothetical protein